MGAVGAVGGVVGGLGSLGGDSATSFDAGAASDAAAAANVGGSSYTQSWFNANAVMSTSGDVQGSEVGLRDNDLSAAGVGQLDDKQYRVPMVEAGNSIRQPQPGVGDSPSAEVVDRVASVYAAQAQTRDVAQMAAG